MFSWKPNQGLRLYTSTPLPVRDRRCLSLHGLLAARRSHWLQSAVWTGTGTWPRGTVRRPSRRENPLPAGRVTNCGCWWRRSYPGQKESWPGLWHGGGSLGTLWRGYSPCTPSTRQMYSHGWGACLAPCGFLVSKSTSSPTSRSVGRTASTSPWETKRPRPVIRF